MTERAAHENYKELSRELNELSKDLIKGLVALRAVTGENKGRVERIEGRVERVAADLVSLASRLDKFEARVESDARHARDRAASQDRITAEGTKGRWLLWVALVGGVFSLVSAGVKLAAELIR